MREVSCTGYVYPWVLCYVKAVGGHVMSSICVVSETFSPQYTACKLFLEVVVVPGHYESTCMSKTPVLTQFAPHAWDGMGWSPVICV